jgi:MYXO-CTERM domain-containing protein
MLLAASVCVVAGSWWGGDPRPVLTGPEEIVDTADGRFRIHFTPEGADATDDDAVAWAEAGFAETWAEFVDGDGWPAPPPDLGEGGDDRLDVYLRDLDANGYAHEVPLPAGPTGCWIELDPAVAATLGETTFQSVAGHELHHCLQFAVTPSLASWIYEATSTYAQYLLFGERDETLDLGKEFLWRLRLAGSRRALDDVGAQFEYAAMVWSKFLVDRAGDRRALLELWQAMAAAGSWEGGHEAYLGSLAATVAEAAVWNLFACDRDDGRHWADDPATCRLDGAVRPTVVAALPASGTAGPIARYGSEYVELTPDCESAALHVEVTPEVAMTVQVVAVTPWQESAVTRRDAAAGETVVVDVADWGWSTKVVVIGTSAGGEGSFVWSASASGTYTAPDEGEVCAAEPAGCGCRTGGDPGVLLAMLIPVIGVIRRRTPVS